MRIRLLILILAFMLLMTAFVFLPKDFGQQAPLPPTITPIWIATSTPVPTTTALPSPTPTKTAAPTFTPIPPTATQVPPTVVPPSPTPLPLSLQKGSPGYLPAFAHVSEGCQWWGVAGQIFDNNGSGMANAVVSVSGVADGKNFERLALSLAESSYGPGGYEIALGDVSAPGGQELEILVYDLQGHLLAGPERFRAPASCEQNLVLLNFAPLVRQ